MTFFMKLHRVGMVSLISMALLLGGCGEDDESVPGTWDLRSATITEGESLQSLPVCSAIGAGTSDSVCITSGRLTFQSDGDGDFAVNVRFIEYIDGERTTTDDSSTQGFNWTEASGAISMEFFDDEGGSSTTWRGTIDGDRMSVSDPDTGDPFLVFEKR